MPQPVNPSAWSFAPKSTLSRPAISVAIAAVLTEWTRVEQGLIALVGNALGTSTDPKKGKFSLKTNMFAYDIMGSAQNVRDRISLLEVAIGSLIAGSQLEERGKKFFDDLKARSKERNRIAHAVWMISNDFPGDLIEYQSKSKKMFRWTEKDIILSLDRIVAIRADTHQLLMDIIGAIHTNDLAEREFGPWRA